MPRRPVAGVFPFSLLGPGAGVFRNFREHSGHGADISAPIGSRVPAPRAGIIVSTGWIGPRDPTDRRSLGYGIVLHDPAALEWWLMGHGTGRYFATRGATVLKGAPIMESGNSGYSGGPHVHLERWANVPWPRKGKLLDPLEGTPYASAMPVPASKRPPAATGFGSSGGFPAAGASPVDGAKLPRGWYAR